MVRIMNGQGLSNMIIDAIEDLSNDLMKKPSWFFSEHDCHNFLYNAMVSRGIEHFRIHKEYPTNEKRKKTISARPRCDLSIFSTDTKFEKLLRFRERKEVNPLVPEAAIELSLDYGESHFKKDVKKLINGWREVQPQPLKFIVHIVRMFWVNGNLSPRSWLDEEKLLNQKSKEHFDFEKIDYIRYIRGPINKHGSRKLFSDNSDKVYRPHWRDIEIRKGKAIDRVFCVEKDRRYPNSREASVCQLCDGSFPAGLKMSFSRAKRRRAV